VCARRTCKRDVDRAPVVARVAVRSWGEVLQAMMGTQMGRAESEPARRSLPARHGRRVAASRPWGLAAHRAQ